MAQYYVWWIVGNLDKEKINDMLNKYGFKITSIMYENLREKWTIMKTDDTEPIATEKNSTIDYAKGIGIGLRWI